MAMWTIARGFGLQAVTIRDDLCWPGEEAYLSAACGGRLDLVRVPESMLDRARSLGRGALLSYTDDRRADSLSAPWFRAADRYWSSLDRPGIVWGVRADESRHRAITVAQRGVLYARQDRTWVCAPLARWSALDVHAALWSAGVPAHPVYLCVDPGQDAMALRHSWWVVGGSAAERHYPWLRRWWPRLYDEAAAIDPAVAALG